MWIDQPPAAVHPLVEGEIEVEGPDGPVTEPDPVLRPDTTRTVLLYPLRADLVDACAAWAGVPVRRVGGIPALFLSTGNVVGLGDYVAREPGRDDWCEQAAGISQRWTPTAT